MISARQLQSIEPSALLACKLSLLVACLLVAATAHAQIGISSITTSTTDLANTVTNGVTFDNTTTSITQFKDTAGNIYNAATGLPAPTAIVDRNALPADPNNSSVWYANGAAPAGSFSAPYASTLPSLLVSNNILRGSDNTFDNNTGTPASSDNIERLDFILNPSGFAATTSTAFAVFDRGLAGAHDGFEIAVITGWNGTAVTAYSGVLVTTTSASYGGNVVSDFNYNLFRYSTGSNLTNWTANTETGTQGIGGTIVSMSDLGIAPGTTIYGYSLMATDVTDGGNVANLVDFTNATFYPTSTPDTNGGIDLSAVNGVLYNRVAPEPSTYGAMFVGLTAAFLGWRRHRRHFSAPAA